MRQTADNKPPPPAIKPLLVQFLLMEVMPTKFLLVVKLSLVTVLLTKYSERMFLKMPSAPSSLP